MSEVLRGEAIRFLIAGAINTVVTYALYFVLLLWWPYALAYTASYVVGIVLSYWLSTRFVFRVQGSAKRFATFPIVYAVQYGVGLAVLHAAITVFNVPQRLAMLASIAVSVPLTFVLSRFVLKFERAPRSS